MIEVNGTTSRKLNEYIQRVSDYLGLHQYEAFVELEVVKQCSSMAGGYCHGDEDSIYVELARYDSVGKVPMKDLMINIAHELVHAQQIASGRLVNKGFTFKSSPSGKNDILTTKQIFDGKEYIGVAYRDQPWEKEAYSLEKVIYEECK